MSTKELKKHYNELLIRHNKAASFLDDRAIPIDEKERHILVFREIIQRMESILIKMRAAGHEATKDEILYGFKKRG